MSGGGGFMGPAMGQVISQMEAANRSGGRGADYTPVQANVYGSPFTSRQAGPLPRTSPLAQQMMDRSSAANPYGQGLQSIYSMFNTPRQLAPMPMYRVPALNYRPSTQSSQEVLQRVAPSVAEQQRRQAVEDARRAAEEEARRAAEAGDGGGSGIQSYYDYGGGG